MSQSRAEWVRSLPEARRAQWLAGLEPREREALRYSWGFWGRPEQWSPWSIHRGDRVAALERYAGAAWIAGRGFGKTRLGAECVIEEARVPKARIALIARTAADARDVMIEGESGILARSRPDERPIYEPSKRRLTWPSGAIATTYSADEPDQLRGPQHSFAWGDEVAAWTIPDAWDQLQLGLRLGKHPRWIVTTTPRPTAIVRKIIADPRALVTRGSTHANAANLAPSFLDALRARYEGTALGRQEIYAEILDESPGALWRRAWLDERRVSEAPSLRRVVVAIDPAVTSRETSDETGIVVAGVAGDRGYVLADESGRMTPEGWAARAIEAFDRHKADRVVAEANQGGDMVSTILRAKRPGLPITLVHASRGKHTRAEPVAALYEQGRVSHVGSLPLLEDQLVTWDGSTGAGSPDRLDALVWAITDLMVDAPIGVPLTPAASAPEADWRSAW